MGVKMAGFDQNTRMEITKKRQQELEQRMKKLGGSKLQLAKEVNDYYHAGGYEIRQIAREFYREKEKRPSQWFEREGNGLLDVFVPVNYQASYLYIIDKFNQFPFSRGWQRRTVRTAGYGPQIEHAFLLMSAYEKLYFIGDKLEDYIYRRLPAEKLDYIKNTWNFNADFSLIYAAEIDRGNRAVIDALRDLILSENNTAYLDREMILGIFRSDNRELHKLTGDLLVAARLQEGLRQAICESMDEGTKEAFMTLLRVIEEQDLIRYSSVKRAISTWIGIFDEHSVDRVSAKLLTLMEQCLSDRAFCRQQCQSNDSIAISTALWALGFEEVEEAIRAMAELIDHGSKNQKLTASLYNQSLYDDSLKIRMARKVIVEHTDDMELVAAFLPAYTVRLQNQISLLLVGENKWGLGYSEVGKPKKPVLTEYFKSREDAELLYQRFEEIYERLPKKGVVYDPCIFPWYRVELKPSVLVRQMAFTAYVLQDEEKITDMAARLGEVMSGDRHHLVNLLLYAPANKRQRELLIDYMGSAEEITSTKAVAMVKRLSLQKEDYRQMEEMLRFKRSGLRSHLLEFLAGQDDACMEECLGRLLADKKEEKRGAGLDLLLRLSKREDKAALFGRVKPLAAAIEAPTDKEKVLLEEILGQGSASAAKQKGYGIYDPDAPEKIPQETDWGREQVLKCLPLSEQEIIRKLKKLDAIIKDNKDYEYKTVNGDRELLGNQYVQRQKQAGEKGTGYGLENFPLAGELRAVFGKEPFRPEPLCLEYTGQVKAVCRNYRYEFYDRKLLFESGLQAVKRLTEAALRENNYILYHRVGELCLLDRLFEGLGAWETDEEFVRAFYTAWRFELKCGSLEERGRFVTGAQNYALADSAMTPIVPYWFVKAYHMGLISRDNLLVAIMHYFNRRTCLQTITQLVKGDYSVRNRGVWRKFFGANIVMQVWQQGEALAGGDTWCGQILREIYDAVVPVIVDTELRRGEGETAFSEDVRGITYLTGVDSLVRILKALGKDTLGRESYYSWYYAAQNTKREVLSRLLKACYPLPGESGETLGKALKGTAIKTERLVEVAMYAPQWIDIIQEYLGWKGMQSGCYYFMAHMNERFDDQKMALIARYTPLSAEELQRGAFDIAWFEEAYGMLGEKHFEQLYKAAKYIADGQKHSRARKYADAATGKVTLEELRTQIREKRNKDLLMSYGLVPFEADREKDLLERYQFIQQYAEEAKQFGSQRRVSEARAAEIALVNLSVHAGFSDVDRLTLKMESRLAEEFADYRKWTTVGDVEVCLHVDESGKSEILCRKDGKEMKSLPSRLGKDFYVLEVKDAHKKLKEQYSRARKLMEESMESGAEFAAGEVAELMTNPVIRAILAPLVFVAGGETDGAEANGFLVDADVAQKDGVILLRSWDDQVTRLRAEQKVRIAHPLDLYRAKIWNSYQSYLFAHQIRQPFKQVFRELYVKLPEELGLKASRMFAGNQIQPRKTVGCLKGRRWIADYEEGLQKIYYKENMIARIYAMADWFSPADTEESTLEWVEFFDRKTFQALTIADVPDLIYSEVMRDVDLAVSVAHAGGVDPETSHSTIEMRRAIVEFNLPLFQLKNVVLKDSHALIHGTRGNYNVHLGSGVVHQEGGAMLNILPVHSQKRGKLFLPFVDEDPKTAEILSKIVLLAEDQKIKDPFILDQIKTLY
ncbi:MAG: DUF4132 domain-containing protein [Candidatus Gastranaerophilales bacterium]|nr:DUF4132 domain-containing protein [Candidatus Gastranaerophilales bacterium]